MDKLAWDFKEMCKHNSDGAFATRADRQKDLHAISVELKSLGYRHVRAHTFKTKHVNAQQ